jgi:2-phosphoglycerate kinase
MSKIILIGGAPTVGKTYTAKRLSKKIGVSWISTDMIRSFMRNFVLKKDYPKLFEFVGSDVTAEKYLSSNTPKQIVKSQNKESIEVWKGVKYFIKSVDRSYASEENSYIIEGVAILPHLINKTFKKNKNIKPVFLLNKDIDQIRKVVFKRGLWGDAKEYSDDVKSVEVEWANLFNGWIEKEAKKYGYPVYEIKKWGFPIEDIVKLVK